MGDEGLHTEREPRWRRRKEGRPREILESAMDLFVRQGFAQTRMEQVARQAGIQTGTLYLYYQGKEDLLRAAVREGLSPVLTWADQLLERPEGSGEDRLKALYAGWREHLGQGPLAGLPKLMAAESGNFPELARFWHDEVVQRVRALFVKALALGVERGEFEVPDIELAARTVIAPLMVASLQVSAFAESDPGGRDIEVWLDASLALLLRGLASSRGASEREP